MRTFLRLIAGLAASVGCAAVVAALYDLETVLAGLTIGLFLWPSVILLLILERFGVSRTIRNLAYLASLAPLTIWLLLAAVEDRGRDFSDGAGDMALFILTCYLAGALGAWAVLWILRGESMREGGAGGRRGARSVAHGETAPGVPRSERLDG